MRPIMAKAINYMKPDIDPNTRLYVPFNEGVGDLAKDYSQYCNHATLTDVEWSNEGFNGAGKFNGSSSYGNCGNDASLNITDAITIKTWVKFNILPTSRGIVGKMAGGGDVNSWMLYAHASSKVSLYIYDGGVAKNTPASPDAVVVDTRYYLVGTYDGIILRMYVNGIEVETLSYTGDMDTTSSYVSIGKNVNGPSINGTKDNVIIISTTNNVAQIAADCYEVVCS